jgi:DNA-binding HxlR family transcriptional regulator
LTLTLPALERDGLLTRTVTPSIPPHVDYELTRLGRSLLEPGEGVQHLGAQKPRRDRRGAGAV